jgi:hypothetical protein
MLTLHAELTPVTLVLGMNEKGRKQIDILDVRPAATAREQIGAAASHGWCHLHLRERGSPMKNRKREICTSGSVVANSAFDESYEPFRAQSAFKR